MSDGIHWPQTIAVLSALTVVQAAILDQFWLGGRLRVDILLLVVVSVGLTASVRDATVLGFVIGVFVDLFRFSPFGLHALIFCLAGWTLANNGARLLQIGPVFRLLQSTVAGLLTTVATWVAAGVFGQRPPPFGYDTWIEVGLVSVVGGVALWPIGRLTQLMVVGGPTRRTPQAEVVRA